MQPFIGTIMPVAFGYAPKGWALCNGQLMAIQTNQALFSLLGTYFGGNGITTFALPDLRGRAAVGVAPSTLGAQYGEDAVTLTVNELPAHTHVVAGSTSVSTATRPVPAANKIFAAPSNQAQSIFGSPTAVVPLGTDNLSPSGLTQPHTNMQPFTVLNYIIALQGIFPSRS